MPKEFQDFSFFCWDGDEPMPETDEMLIDNGIERTGDPEKLRLIREFVSRVLSDLNEKELEQVWSRGTPQIYFSGERAYRDFFRQILHKLENIK